MRNAAILDVAKKYIDDALRTDRPLVYRDALVAEKEIIVKGDEFADDLSGFRGYRLTIRKRGTLSKPTPVVMGNTPTPYAFLAWVKEQPTKVLRALLRANGILATGTVHLPMVHLLVYMYEERRALATGTPLLLDESKADMRAKRIRAFRLAVNLTGVKHDEEVLVQIQNWVESGNIQRGFDRYVERLKERGAMADEKASDIRKRLLAESDKAGKGEKKDEAEGNGDAEGTGDAHPPKESKKGRGGEQAAIEAGKGKKAAKDEPKAEKKKGTKKGGKEEQAATGAGKPNDEVAEDSTVKKTDKKAAKKGKKTENKKTEKVTSKKASGSGAKQSDFKKDDKVKYVGTRNEELKGKTLTVLGNRGPKGVWVKTSDGTRGSAMAHQLEKVK